MNTRICFIFERSRALHFIQHLKALSNVAVKKYIRIKKWSNKQSRINNWNYGCNKAVVDRTFRTFHTARVINIRTSSVVISLTLKSDNYGNVTRH